MTVAGIGGDRSSNGSANAPHLMDASLNCEITGAVRMYRLTQTYLFLEEPPTGIVERNLFTHPYTRRLSDEEARQAAMVNMANQGGVMRDDFSFDPLLSNVQSLMEQTLESEEIPEPEPKKKSDKKKKKTPKPVDTVGYLEL